MTSAYVLIAVVLVLGAMLAVLGDRIGTKVGKARLRIFNLRPRNSATLITVLTGIAIAASTLMILFATSKSLRQGIFRLDEILTQLRTAQQELNSVGNEKAQVEQALDQVSQEKQNVERGLKQIQRGLKQVQNRYNQATRQARILQNEINTLRQQRERLLRQIPQLQEQVRQRDLRIAQQGRSLIEQEGRLSQVRIQRNELQIQRDTLQGQQDRLIGQRNEILGQKEVLLSQRDQLRGQRDQLIRQRGQLQQQRGRLQTEIQKRDSTIQTLDQTIEERDEALQESDLLLQQRELVLKDLTQQLAFLQEEVSQLEQYYQDYQALREGNVALLRGEVLSFGVVKIIDPTAARNAVDELLRQANRKALTATQPLNDSEPTQRIVFVTQAQVENLIQQINDGKEYVVRILSAQNYVEEEQMVRVLVSVSPNEQVFEEGEVIATISVRAINNNQDSIEEKMSILLSATRFRARRAGVLGDIQVENGKINTYTHFLERLIDPQEPVEQIQAIALNPTNTSGPLQLRLLALRNGDVIFSTEDSPAPSNNE